MTGLFRTIRLVKMFLISLIFVALGIFGIVFGTVTMILREIKFHRTYGKDWVLEYEKYYGPLARTNTKIAAGFFGIIAISLLLWWIYREVTSKNRKPTRRRRG